MSHCYIIGQTGTGKSTYSLSEAVDLIHAGHGVSFFDPHGQTAKLLLHHIPAKRIQDVIYIDPSDPNYAVPYNPIAGGDHKTADDIVAAFRHRHVESWGPKLEYVFRSIIHTLTFVPTADLIGVRLMLYNDQYRQRAVSLVTDPVLKLFWGDEFNEYLSARDYGEKTASPILNKVMPTITSPDLRAILCQSSNSIDFRDILDTKKILIVNLAKGLLGETYSNILGTFLISGISQAALSRENIPEAERVPHYLFADEFQNFATGSFAVVLSESRKYKLFLQLTHQYIAQLPDALRDSVFGNVSKIVSFRVGVDDAPTIAKQLGLKSPEILQNLPNYRARMTYLDPTGSPYPAHEIKTQPLPIPRNSKAEKSVAWSNKGTPRELVATYLRDTPLAEMFLPPIPFRIPSQPTMHSWVCAPPGAGKSTLLQYFINEQLPLVAENKSSVVVIDSNRELVQAVAGLKVFAPGEPLAGKLLNIDIEDVEFPFALNLFDVGADDPSYSPADREALRNSTLSLYDYFFTSFLPPDLTSRQNTLFNFTIQLLLEIPGATLDTLIDIMQPNGLNQYADALKRLEPDAQRFFQLKFNDKTYDQTKGQVVDRLYAVKRIRTLARMFSAQKSKLDFFTEMADAKVITINIPLNLLQDEGVEIVGRFFLAMILVAAQKRILLPKEKRLPCHIVIDECHDIIKRDTKIGVFLDQARKLNCSVMVAHQRLNQLQSYVLDALYGSTSIKLASQVSDAAAHALARDMRCTPEFIQKQPDYHFAAFIRGKTDAAVSIKVPHVDMLTMPRMTAEEQSDLRTKIREKYCAPITTTVMPTPPTPEPVMTAPEPPKDAPDQSKDAKSTDSPAKGWGKKKA